MKKWEELVELLQNREIQQKKEEKKCNIILWIMAVIGGIAVIAAIAYAVYCFVTPDYLDDFDDDFDDDFEDDFFEDEEGEYSEL